MDDFARVGIKSHLRREITAEECDADGFFVPPPPPTSAPLGVPGPGGIGGRTSTQGVMDNVWGSVPNFVWPTLEQRTLALRTPRRGDQLDSYTALVSVSDKVIVSGTWVFEAGGGALTTVNHQVNIFFNFETRRPEPMPPPVRARIAGLATPGLLAGRAET